MPVNKIALPILKEKKIDLHLLRLDLTHPFVSGNKWYKLKYNLIEAKEKKYNTLLSFGGPYSNHLSALSYAAKVNGFNLISIIRGVFDESKYSPTLNYLKENNTQFVFVSREEYKLRYQPDYINFIAQKFPQAYIIPEGGANEFGLKGCSEIGDLITERYDLVTVSVGTSSTLTGLLISQNINYNRVEGYMSLRGEDVLSEKINTILKEHNSIRTYQLIRDYHFGGFGKYNSELIDFINWFYNQTGVELDMVYTAKMMYGLLDRVKKNTLPNVKKILAVHTGGLQGNIELKEKNILNF
ncbi:MAG: 1-aminocyclopropane-1-carboxylate deaminase/D-cysteine desulfhydrase [Bacteroidia bacterium]|nr:1-aminocyclopropane-1-carboxylate deaminase/D-cysteine desulfhydrase [Bacteroidia bacterium]